MAVFACGFAKFGQLGLGQMPSGNDLVKTPTLLESFKGKRIIQVDCIEQSSFAVTDHGDLWAWGRGREGQLGQGNKQTHHLPVRVTKLSHEKVIKVASGNYHTVALTETGRVYIWGKLIRLSREKTGLEVDKLSNMVGLTSSNMILTSRHKYLSGEQDEDLHQKDLMESFVVSEEFYQLEPLLVEGDLAEKRIVDISAGYSFTLALTEDGFVYAWGCNDKGQLGLGNRYNIDTPKLITTLAQKFVTKIVCGHHHSLALTKEGEVWSWGMGVFGQLGHGNSKDSLIPRLLREFTLISPCDNHHNNNDNNNGDINNKNEDDNNDNNNSNIQILEPQSKEKNNVGHRHRITSIACGSYHSVAINEIGEVYSWGHGEYGQHGGTQNYQDWGVGEKENHFLIPRRLEGLNSPIHQISCGSLHNCAISVNGDCFSWGWGASGCLGHGDTRFKLIPQPIVALTGEEIVSASCAWKHTLFVKKASESTFALDYEPLVNNIAYSDLIYIVENRPIYCHRVLVFSQCDHLRARYNMMKRFCHENLQYNEKTGAIQIVVPGVTYPVFLGLIQYLYTDHLKIPPHQISKLRDLSIAYSLPRLTAICNRALIVNAAVGNQQSNIVIPPSVFSSNIRDQINNTEFADFCFLSVDGKKLHCHKSLLISRSSYFQKLFQGGFMESASSQIVLDADISYQTMCSVVEYLYTGDEGILNGDNTVDILIASDRFDIYELKQTCEDIIEQNLDIESVCWILELGDRYNAPRLTRCAFELFGSSMQNLSSILQTDGFKNLPHCSPHLLRSLDYYCAKKKISQPGFVIRSQPRLA